MKPLRIFNSQRAIRFSARTFLLSVFFLACSPSYKTSPNGLQYVVYTDAKQKKPALGDVVQFYSYWRNDKDSIILNTSRSGHPLFGVINKPKFKGDPIELLGMMGEGDSASCKMNVDSLFRNFPLPPELKHGQIIRLDLKVLKVMSPDEYKGYLAKQDSLTLMKEQTTLEDYIQAQKWMGTKTPSGMYVVIDEPGSGKDITDGTTISVKYKGSLLDGTVFDSTRAGSPPYTFTVGQSPVIQGWVDGLKYFKKGGKGHLLIPSPLGYGAAGNPPRIPPNSPLVFDVEIMDVK